VKDMKLSGLQKTSLIDFPDRIASVLFTHGCNLRCPYCYNWRLILDPQEIQLTEEDALEILRSRKNYVEGVVVTGGEPTMHKDLPQFLKRLKEDGFAVKLDTNGFFVETLLECLPFVDYVALDVKTSLGKYTLLGAQDMIDYLRTVEILKEGRIDYEFRSTVVPHFITEEDILGIGELVEGAKRFALQQFIPGDTLDKKFSSVQPYPNENVIRFADMMRKYAKEVVLRL